MNKQTSAAKGKFTESNQDKLHRRSVLVVGDWVVDEHWVTGIERSATASRRGESHRHALHNLRSTVDALSGAGLTSSVLARARLKSGTKGRSICDVHGLGVWHPGDHKIVRAMMVPKNTQGRSPFRATWPIKYDELENVTLHNLANLIPNCEERCATTTVIRIYERTSYDAVQLLKRIDWELRPDRDGNGAPCWVSEKVVLDDLMKPSDVEGAFLPRHPAAIVIKDLVKGVVSERMIDWLVATYGKKKIPWFISSKSFQPKWLDKLHNQMVRLLVIPPVAAQEAVRQFEGIGGWCVGPGLPSPGALNLIQKQDERLYNLCPTNPRRLIVALPIPERICVLAKSTGQGRTNRLLVQPDDVFRPTLVGVPMASVLFGAMVALLVEDQNGDDQKILEMALEFTNQWMVHQSKRIEKPIDWDPQQEPNLILESGKQAAAKTFQLNSESWELAQGKWHQAHSFQGRGIIEEGGKRRIELWRSMIDVDHCVSLTQFKRSAIQSLNALLDRFRDSSEQRPMSAMLIAKPGSGKSYLMSRLASKHKFRFLNFNIAQMVRKEDVFDAFDAIVSAQADVSQGREALVFFDEINAPIENSQIYTAFLDPIECGTYRRFGKAFHIRRCVWVFAGTAIDPGKTESKGSDFLSRLTIKPIQFDSDSNDNSDAAKLERVYLGVSRLKEEFPEVQYVSKKVIDAFAHLDPALSFREQVKFVRGFQNVRDCVWASNIPAQTLIGRMFSSDIEAWHKAKENTEERIEIVRVPQDQCE